MVKDHQTALSELQERLQALEAENHYLKQREKQLQVSEQMFRNIATNMPGAIFQFCNRQGVWTVDYMSDRIYDITGINAQEIMADLNIFISTQHPDDLDNYIQSIVTAVTDLTPWHYEGRLIRPDGNIKWWQGDSRPTQNTKGEIVFCGVIIDITERKFMEERLLSSENELRALFEAMNDVVLVIDRHGYYVKIAPTNPHLLYKPSLELLGKNLREVMPLDIANTFLENFPISLDEQKTINIEYSLPIEQEIKWFDATISPLQNNLVIVVSRDITPRKHAELLLQQMNEELEWRVTQRTLEQQQIVIKLEQEVSDRLAAETQLRESQELLQVVIDTIPQCIAWKDRNLTFLGCNQQFADVVGIKEPWKIVGKNDFELSATKEQAEVYRQVDELVMIRDQPQLRFVETHQSANGEDRWIETSKLPLHDQDGQVNGILVMFEDITERKLAEANLEKIRQEKDAQSALFRRVLDSSLDCIFAKDKNLKYILANQSFANLMNKTIEDILGRDDLELGIPEEVVLGNTQKGIRGYRNDDFLTLAGENVYIPLELLPTLDGSHLFCETQKMPLRNNDNEIIGVLGIARDITERLRYQETIQNFQKRLELLFENSPIALMEWDENFNIVTWNSSAEKIFGYSKQEALGRYAAELIVHEATRPIVDQVFTALLQQTGGTRSVNENITKDGRTIICEWYNTPIISMDGKVISVASMAIDITSRRQVEQQLQEQAQFLQSIWDGVEYGIFVLDVLEQGADFRYNAFNPSMQRSGAISSEFLLGKTVSEALPPEIVDNYLGLYRQCVDSGKSLMREERFVHEDQETWWLLNITPLRRTDNGEIVQLVITATDISDRKEAEAALIQSEAELREKAIALEEALDSLQRTQMQLVQTEKMSSLGQLVAGIAHEINNPVNFIYGNLIHTQDYIQSLLDLIDLYQRDYPQPSDEIIEKIDEIDLEFIRSDLPQVIGSMKMGAERIEKIVSSLRTFSRLDESAMKEINIHDGLESTLMILQNRLGATPEHREIEVIREYGDLPPVECYAGELNQVFMNILNNAIDALEERESTMSLEEIAVNPSYIKISTVQAEKEVLIKIADNGLGMPETVRNRLFDPFFTTKAVGKGTGMGLSICYQIITQRHGGKIDCISTAGVGTEFMITIPMRINHFHN
jgi:PAS domain S-box-containing protein